MAECTDAAVNGREADSSIGTSQDLSPTVHVVDKEEATIPHASNKFTHDPLGASADEHGSKHSHKHRRWSKRHSSGSVTPVGNPTRNDKDQKHSRTSRKSTSNTSMKGQFIISRFCALYHESCTLRLVFTNDRVVVGVIIRSIERYDLVKIKPVELEAEHRFCL